jgi:hypothetical protein
MSAPEPELRNPTPRQRADIAVTYRASETSRDVDRIALVLKDYCANCRAYDPEYGHCMDCGCTHCGCGPSRFSGVLANGHCPRGFFPNPPLDASAHGA